MTYKSLFKGKRKLFSIPALLGFTSIFFPFVAGAALSVAVLKYIPNNIARVIVIGFIALVSIPFGGGWIAGLTGQFSSPNHQELKAVTTVNSEEKTIKQADTPTPSPQATPTTEPTITPTPTPTSTPVPTKKPVIVYPTKAPVIQKLPTYTPVPVQKVQPIAQPIQQVAPVQQSSGGGDKNCPDFATHADAQTYFNSKGGSPSNNVDGLDRDHDGIACENNP